jgi:hypothetical protein
MAGEAVRICLAPAGRSGRDKAGISAGGSPDRVRAVTDAMAALPARHERRGKEAAGVIGILEFFKVIIGPDCRAA